MTISYTAIATNQLKATTVTSIAKFWDGQLKAMNITYQGEPGFRASVEQLGANHFIDTFQKYAIDDDGALAEGYSMYTLGELSASRETENELVQFEVISTRVETFLNESATGLLKTMNLYEPMLVLVLPNGDFIVGGGRHRLSGLLTLYKFVEGWQHCNIAVRTVNVASIAEAVNYIRASNGSRAMTKTEITKLTAASRGLTAVRSSEEILEQVARATTLTDIKAASLLYYLAAGSESPVVGDLTGDTLGTIGTGVVSKLASRLNSLGKGAALRLFRYNRDGENVAAMLVSYSFEIMTSAWGDIMEGIKQPVRDRKTGDVKVDPTTGEVVYTANVARSASYIAGYVVDSLMSVLEEELNLTYRESTEAEAAAKTAKADAVAAKKARTQANQAKSALEYIQAAGIPLTAEQVSQLQAYQTQAMEQAEVPQGDNLASQLDALLS